MLSRRPVTLQRPIVMKFFKSSRRFTVQAAVMIAALTTVTLATRAEATPPPPSLTVFTPTRMERLHITFASPSQAATIDGATAVQDLEKVEPGLNVLQTVLVDATGVDESTGPRLCYAIAVSPGLAISSGLAGGKPPRLGFQVEFVDATTGTYLGYVGGA
jgi:hypothetical protein